jgi:hypothetical protein
MLSRTHLWFGTTEPGAGGALTQLIRYTLD